MIYHSDKQIIGVDIFFLRLTGNEVIKCIFTQYERIIFFFFLLQKPILSTFDAFRIHRRTELNKILYSRFVLPSWFYIFAYAKRCQKKLHRLLTHETPWFKEN